MTENPYVGAQATGFALTVVSGVFVYSNEPTKALVTLGLLVVLTLGYYGIMYR